MIIPVENLRYQRRCRNPEWRGDVRNQGSVFFFLRTTHQLCCEVIPLRVLASQDRFKAPGVLLAVRSRNSEED